MIKIDQALIDFFITCNFFDKDSIAHENLKFIPDDDIPYAELKVISGEIVPYTMADTDKTEGIFKIILRYPLETGTIIIKNKADEILSAFEIGSYLSYTNELILQVIKKSRGEAIPRGGMCELTIDISYMAFLER